MELTKSDIEELKKIQCDNSKEYYWLKEKRKPIPEDFGLTDAEYKKLLDIQYCAKIHRKSKLYDCINGVFGTISTIYLWFSPFLAGLFLERWPVFGCIYTIIWIVSFFSSMSLSFELLDLISLKSDDIKYLDAKIEYERNLILYEKWLVYNKTIVEKQIKRENNWIIKQANFPYIEALTNAFKTISWSMNKSYWKDLTPYEFERNVGKLYEKVYGYNVCVTVQSGDGGIDVVLRKKSEVKYVQCKHYSSNNHLGVRELREFYGVCVADSVKGIIVCTSSLTVDAMNFYDKIKETIELVGIDDLIRMSKILCPHDDITSRLDIEFKSYIDDNHFLCFHHCYVLPKCFKTDEDANMKISQLMPYTSSTFCYKVMDIVDQENFHFFIIALVESKYSYLYNTFRVKYAVNYV